MNDGTATEPAAASVDVLDAGAVFERLVVGVDGSEAGFEAVRQASRLVAPDGWLELFSADYMIDANLAGWSAPEITAQLERELRPAMRRAEEIAGPRAETRLVNGPPLPSLMHELEEKQSTLAVLGTHDHRRFSEIMIGGVVGELLHNAPCSVLIARPPSVAAFFPYKIVAGVDGSPESDAAAATARYLADRFRAQLHVVTALRDKRVDLDRARMWSPVEVEKHPVEALAEIDADIVVVGSRGLHGLRALGSVSERVAHRADCSVLVVHAASA
jgi:nucleotide-binding universal stress UspA family protein